MKPEVRIRDRRRGVVVVAMLGDGPPKVTGYKGWQSIARPKRVPMTDWTEGESLRQSIPILLDGLVDDRSVQHDFDRLESMARKKGQQRPPTVAVSGPVHHTDLIWVVEDIDWGDANRNTDGVLVRQAATLMLLDYEAVDLVSPAQRARDRTGPLAGRRYNVRSGDTLLKIAAQQLGSADRWQEIGELNGIRDPRRLLRNMQIQLPER